MRMQRFREANRAHVATLREEARKRSDMPRNDVRPEGHLTEAEAAERVGVSSGRLCKMRKGHRYRGKTRKGSAYYSNVPPVLELGVHYIWERGRVWYTPRGIAFLEERSRSEESKAGKETGGIRAE